MALELPADIFVIWSLDYFGRRWSTAISMILSSLATMLCAILIGKYGAGLGFVSQSLKLVTRRHKCTGIAQSSETEQNY